MNRYKLKEKPEHGYNSQFLNLRHNITVLFLIDLDEDRYKMLSQDTYGTLHEETVRINQDDLEPLSEKEYYSIVHKNKDKVDQVINEMSVTLQEIFPDEWEITSRPKFPVDKPLHDVSIIHTITIHFPEIKITNSEKSTHTIRDLFVRFEMVSNSIIGTVLMEERVVKGLRTTLTNQEIASHYQHSHLPTHCYSDSADREVKLSDVSFDNFCLGEATPIQMDMLDLKNGYTDMKFNSFLYNLISTVHWESLEGLPYISIDAMVPQSARFNTSPEMGYEVLVTSDEVIDLKYTEDAGFVIDYWGGNFIDVVNKLFSIEAYDGFPKVELSAAEQMKPVLFFRDNPVYGKVINQEIGEEIEVKPPSSFVKALEQIYNNNLKAIYAIKANNLKYR